MIKCTASLVIGVLEASDIKAKEIAKEIEFIRQQKRKEKEDAQEDDSDKEYDDNDEEEDEDEEEDARIRYLRQQLQEIPKATAEEVRFCV